MRKPDKEWTDRVPYPASRVDTFNRTETRGRSLPARDIRAGPNDEKREQEKAHDHDAPKLRRLTEMFTTEFYNTAGRWVTRPIEGGRRQLRRLLGAALTG